MFTKNVTYKNVHATILFTPSLSESKAMSNMSYFPERNANLLNGWSLYLEIKYGLKNTAQLAPTLTLHGEELHYRY